MIIFTNYLFFTIKLYFIIVIRYFSEWHVVQLTSEHEHLTDIMDRRQSQDSNYSLKPTHGLHLIVLPTGKDAINPICLTVPKPNNSSTYDIRLEMETLLNNNKSDLTTTFTNHDLYWKMRKKQNERMKVSINYFIDINTYIF